MPELTERVTGDASHYRERLIDYITALNIQLEFKESIAPTLGMSYGGKIVLLPANPPGRSFRLSSMN